MKGIFNKDITWKIISICVAIILWLYVIDVQNPYISFNYRDISVDFINTEVMEQHYLVFLEGEELDVTVKLRGRRNIITGIHNSSIKATVNLSGLKGLTGISEFSIPIQIDISVNPANAVEIVNQEPYSATVVVDKIVQIQVPIDVVTSGDPSDAYVIGEPIVSSVNASIKGPSSILANVNSIRALVDVSDYSNDVSKVQEYVIVDGEGNRIENEHVLINVDDVTVNVPIKKRKEVPITHQFMGTLVENYVISDVRIVPSSIAIIGDDNRLEEIDEVLTEPINIDGITESFNVNIPLVLGEDINVEDGRTSVAVRVNVQKEETQKISSKNIRINNTKDTFNYHIETEELEIQLWGTENLLKHLETENIKVSADVSGLAEGIHEVKTDIIAPSGIKVQGNYNVIIRVDRR